MVTLRMEVRTNPAYSHDDIINDVREAVARSGLQVGNCKLVKRGESGTVVLLEVDREPSMVQSYFSYGQTEIFFCSLVDDYVWS